MEAKQQQSHQQQHLSKQVGNLVLGRKPGETVIVRDIITGEVIVKVTVAKLQQDKVRLAFAASRQYAIAREELEQTEAITSDNERQKDE